MNTGWFKNNFITYDKNVDTIFTINIRYFKKNNNKLKRTLS